MTKTKGNHVKEGNANRGNDFDNVFKSLKVNHKELFIPVINDLFGKHYTKNDKAVLLSSEGYINDIEKSDGGVEVEERVSDFLLKIGSDTYLLECQSYNDGSMAIRIAEYAFMAARQNAVWENGRYTLHMPNYCVIYVKSTASTPRETKVTYVFPDGTKVNYDAGNIILKEYTKEEIVEKHLYPFIPYYVLRYEKEIKSGTASIDNVIMDLEYLKKGLKEALENGFISSYDEANIRAYMNMIIKHVTNGNKNEERLVNIVGGTVIVTEADKIYKKGIEKGINILVKICREAGMDDEKIIEKIMSEYDLTYPEAESFM